jgi:hypothetical protein
MRTFGQSRVAAAGARVVVLVYAERGNRRLLCNVCRGLSVDGVARAFRVICVELVGNIGRREWR